MAGVSIVKETYLFEYTACNSPLSRLNPLLKLAALIISCITAAVLPERFIFLLIPVYIPLFISAGKGAALQLAGMWKLYIFFIISGAIKYLATGSVLSGAAFSVLLLLMFFSGLLFYTTTKISEFRRTTGIILGLLPFVNGERVADLLAMTMAFLPLIFKTAGELREAEHSRCFNPRKNPIRTLKLKSIPLMINLFIKSEEMTDAYYSRCYGIRGKK
jgi:energy-coupling factor transporter transmembrane protein EcfT